MPSRPEIRANSRWPYCTSVISREHTHTLAPARAAWSAMCMPKADLPTPGRAPITVISPGNMPPVRASSSATPVMTGFSKPSYKRERNSYVLLNAASMGMAACASVSSPSNDSRVPSATPATFFARSQAWARNRFAKSTSSRRRPNSRTMFTYSSTLAPQGVPCMHSMAKSAAAGP